MSVEVNVEKDVCDEGILLPKLRCVYGRFMNCERIELVWISGNFNL